MLLSNGKRYIHTKATSNTQLILVQAQNVISKSCCYSEFAFEVVTNEENLAEIIIIPISPRWKGWDWGFTAAPLLLLQPRRMQRLKKPNTHYVNLALELL